MDSELGDAKVLCGCCRNRWSTATGPYSCLPLSSMEARVMDLAAAPPPAAPFLPGLPPFVDPFPEVGGAPVQSSYPSLYRVACLLKGLNFFVLDWDSNPNFEKSIPKLTFESYSNLVFFFLF